MKVDFMQARALYILYIYVFVYIYSPDIRMGTKGQHNE